MIVDPATGRSKGYGFVRFASEAERDKSLEMQGFQLSNRPIRVSLATARRSPSAGMPGIHPAELDPTNTTLFIGGLSTGVSEEELRAIFARYGDVVYTKIPQGKGCGFVQFVNRPDAEIAMQEMNGQIVGSSAIRISWGRSTSRTAVLQAQAQRPLGTYSYSTGYTGALDPYGAAVAAAPAAAAGLAPTAGLYAAAPAGMPAASTYGVAGGTVYSAAPTFSAGIPAAMGDAAYTLGAAQVRWQSLVQDWCMCSLPPLGSHSVYFLLHVPVACSEHTKPHLHLHKRSRRACTSPAAGLLPGVWGAAAFVFVWLQPPGLAHRQPSDKRFCDYYVSPVHGSIRLHSVAHIQWCI